MNTSSGMPNPWDTLSRLFAGETTADGIPQGAADNILLAWPPILHAVDMVFDRTKRLAFLDFGCGSGDFCRKLADLGHSVTGSDPAVKMRQAAARRVPDSVQLVAPGELFARSKLFDVISAIMVFPFIERIEETVAQLLALMKPSSLLVFAVFNPPFVTNLLAQGMLFHSFDTTAHPARGVMELVKGIPVPVYIRSADEYIALLGRRGKEICRLRPPFTPGFLEKYPAPFSTKDSEFLIQGFVKEKQG